MKKKHLKTGIVFESMTYLLLFLSIMFLLSLIRMEKPFAGDFFQKKQVLQLDHSVNWSRENDLWISLTEDPNIIVSYETGNTLMITLDLLYETELMGNVYYAGEDLAFCEEKMIPYRFHNGRNEIRITEGNVESLRLDLVNKSNVALRVKECTLQGGYGYFLHHLAWFEALIVILLIRGMFKVKDDRRFTIWKDKDAEPLRKPDPYFLYGGMLCIFLLAFLCSTQMIFTKAPDENDRYNIPLWIYSTGTLPTGLEAEIRNPVWGYSHALFPYLIQILSAFCMKVASFFTKASSALLIAARFPSVLSYTALFGVSYLVGEELFDREESARLLAVMTVSLPQVFSLSVYVNNDAPGLLECEVLLYLWILGLRRGFTNKICVLLGITIGITALTYYNTYGFILCSVLVFFYGNLVKNKLQIGKTILKGMVVFVISVLIAGWYFVRNAILYNGDFLGLDTCTECSEKYAVMSYKPSQIYNGINAGKGVIEYFSQKREGETWLRMTLHSMIGRFGYMEYQVPEFICSFWIFLIIVGLAGFIFAVLYEKKKGKREKWFAILILLTSFFIPWYLSLTRSYHYDWEPQGRYVIMTIVPLFACAAGGLSYWTRLLGRMAKKDEVEKSLTFAVELGCFAMWLISFVTTFSPNCLALSPMQS